MGYVSDVLKDKPKARWMVALMGFELEVQKVLWMVNLMVVLRGFEWDTP